jgi:RNA polymerase sigma factor for flagellar operon FliA
MTLVRKLASRMFRRLKGYAEHEDLVSDGCIGLLQAVAAFDQSRGVKLSTYCGRRILGAMLDGVRNRNKLSRSCMIRQRRVAAVRRTLERQLGRQATQFELAAEIGIDEEVIFHIQNLEDRSTIASLDQPSEVQSARETTRDTSIEDPNAIDPSKAFENEDNFRHLLRGLNARDSQIMDLRYRHGLTMAEIGRKLGICEARVSQLIDGIHKRLRERLSDRHVAESPHSPSAQVHSRSFANLDELLSKRTDTEGPGLQAPYVAEDASQELVGHETSVEATNETAEQAAEPAELGLSVPSEVMRQIELIWQLVSVAGGFEEARAAIDGVAYLLDLEQ